VQYGWYRATSFSLHSNGYDVRVGNEAQQLQHKVGERQTDGDVPVRQQLERLSSESAVKWQMLSGIEPTRRITSRSVSGNVD
jgi:hypothetical protein